MSFSEGFHIRRPWSLTYYTKTGTPVTLPHVEHSPFHFWVEIPYGTDRKMDGHEA